MFTKAFWIVISVHIAVFTYLGLFTDRGWSLLVTFLCLFVPTVVVKRLLVAYAKRHPEKKTLRKILNLK